MAGQLEDKIALVTGGGSGIGRATAERFAREGARVIVVDVNVESGEETAHLIHATGGQGLFIKADVSKAEDVEAMVKTAVASYGRLDCAHNNAGILGARAPTAECTEQNWDRVTSIHLKGMWLCMKYEILQMLKQGGGVIVNTSSAVGLVGHRNYPAYVTCKHGIIGLTKAAALEYREAGIRVNAVCPGAIDTPMQAELRGQGNLELGASIVAEALLAKPAQIGTPEDVAAAVVWLCSDQSAFVTGHTLVVDGGSIAGRG
ncbi:MAG: glucose 1-dehydrogenase [Chloroflexi bacterium]|nr:glucose 1-dehydrogenase [Chloroflexota bacterium]